MTAATLACALAALAATRPPAPQEGRKAILDGIAVQAGDALVLLSEYERGCARHLERKPPRNREEEQRARIEVLRTLCALRLEEQRGADLGLDPAQIERISRLDLEAQRDKVGFQTYLAQLGAEGTDALAEEGDHKREIWRYLYEQSILGRAFAAKRATRDQDIRPGELLALFEENKRNLAPITVQLRILAVSSERAGSPEAARTLCEESRARVLAGEELALLVEQHGDTLRESGGLTSYLPPQVIPDPPLALFAEKAEITDLSEVSPLTNPLTGEPQPEKGYQFAELVDRRIPPEPEFSSPEVQRTLREHFIDRRSEYMLESERDRLRRESYVWVNPLLSATLSGSTAPASR